MSEHNYIEIPVGFEPKFGAPLIKYWVISAIHNVHLEIPREVRHMGMVTYVSDIKEMYFFKDGTDDNNLVPLVSALIAVQNKAEWLAKDDREKHDGQIVYCKDENEFFVAVYDEATQTYSLKYIDQHEIVHIPSLSSVDYLSIRNPHVGQIVFTEDTHRFYTFVNGAETIADLYPLNLSSITSTENLDTECPVILRYQGMCIYVEDEKRYYYFRDGINSNHFIPFNDEVLIVNNKQDYTKITNTYEGQLVFVKTESELYQVTNDGSLGYFIKHEITEINYRDSNGYAQIKNPHVGQIVYVRNEHKYYRFAVNSISYTDLIPLFFFFISRMDALDTELPEQIRSIGQIVYVKNLGNFYYFKDGTKKENMVPFRDQVIEIEEKTDFVNIQDARPGQLVYVKNEGEYFISIIDEESDVLVLEYFDKHYVETIESLTSDFDTIRNPHVGQIIYVKDRNTYYTFKTNANTMDDLEPLCIQKASTAQQIKTYINGQIWDIGNKAFVVSNGTVKRIVTAKFEKVYQLSDAPNNMEQEIEILHNLETVDIRIQCVVTVDGIASVIHIPYKIQNSNQVNLYLKGIYVNGVKIASLAVSIYGNDTE